MKEELSLIVAEMEEFYATEEVPDDDQLKDWIDRLREISL